MPERRDAEMYDRESDRSQCAAMQKPPRLLPRGGRLCSRLLFYHNSPDRLERCTATQTSKGCRSAGMRKCMTENLTVHSVLLCRSHRGCSREAGGCALDYYFITTAQTS